MKWPELLIENKKGRWDHFKKNPIKIFTRSMAFWIFSFILFFLFSLFFRSYIFYLDSEIKTTKHSIEEVLKERSVQTVYRWIQTIERQEQDLQKKKEERLHWSKIIESKEHSKTSTLLEILSSLATEGLGLDRIQMMAYGRILNLHGQGDHAGRVLDYLDRFKKHAHFNKKPPERFEILDSNGKLPGTQFVLEWSE